MLPAPARGGTSPAGQSARPERAERARFAAETGVSGSQPHAARSSAPLVRGTTPSRARRRSCSAQAAPSPRGLTRPAELTTRCHGKRAELGSSPSTRPTRRAYRGSPASRATCPYVATRPRGIESTVARMRWRSSSRSVTPAGARSRAPACPRASARVVSRCSTPRRDAVPRFTAPRTRRVRRRSCRARALARARPPRTSADRGRARRCPRISPA